MPASAIRGSFGLAGDRFIDGWLRFAAPIAARYDAEHAAHRRFELRTAILVGLVLYNAYNLTSIVLLADILAFSVALRVCLVTPVSLALIWMIGRTSPVWTERLVLCGMLNAYLIPVSLFWLTRDPLGLFTVGEFSLSIIFANMLLRLRFPHAVVFTACALAATLVAVMTKADLDPALRFAFTVQITTACLFALYANYGIELRRCRDYLVALGATLKADSADVARRKYQDLSRTDTLTGLPNRRHLLEWLDDFGRDPGGLTLMMIDVDHFKLYNDTFGHSAGDECLRRVAGVLAAACPDETVFCARYGGEEFTLAMRGANALEAARVARDLVRSVEGLDIPHPARPDGVGCVTVSVGVLPQDGLRPAPLAHRIAAADEALYLAKKRGRNRFVMHPGGSVAALAQGA